MPRHAASAPFSQDFILLPKSQADHRAAPPSRAGYGGRVSGVRRSEVGTAAVIFPVAVAGRLGALRPADLRRRRLVRGGDRTPLVLVGRGSRIHARYICGKAGGGNRLRPGKGLPFPGTKSAARRFAFTAGRPVLARLNWTGFKTGS